jgi:arabinose-5-phosphate isomerase
VKKRNDIIEAAKRTIRIEAETIAALENQIDESFEKVVKAILKSKGRLVITGIGKSANIAQKLVATYNSTGQPAVFMHAADAIHGDLGMILPEDVVVLISKSGESPEIKTLVPLIREFGNTLIALSGKLDSYLATHADIVIDTVVEQEACPNNLAPTTSTTAQLVMGDALAICLMNLRGVRTDNFARVHQGGALGKRLYLRVQDLANANEKPAVQSDASVQEAILEMTQKRLGVTAVVDADQKLLGVITDGDLRRMLERGSDWSGMKAADIMTLAPKTIAPEALAVEALSVLQDHSITQLAVVADGRYAGMIHLHDLVREGLH